MPTRKVNPTSAGRRGLILPDFSEITTSQQRNAVFYVLKSKRRVAIIKAG